MKKLRLILLATLLINVLCTSCIPACAETADIPIPMNIDIVYDSTEITLGDTITASWTYTAALPIEFYTVTLYMYNADNTSEKILRTSDQSIMSFSYTPTQAGELSLSVSVTGADGRTIRENVRWTIKEDNSPPDAIPMSIDIAHGSTAVTVGEAITASWTYTAALPIEFYTVTLYMYNADNTSEKILRTSDQSITSISYSPTQAGELSLSVSVTGADGRRISENVRWTISNSSVSMQLPGDATGDHVISIDDAIAILKYQTNGNTNINLLNADINNDGNVNIHDALLILQRVAGW